jgi:hypothetical protein
MCKYRHSSLEIVSFLFERWDEEYIPPLEQYPFLTKKLHSGIFLRLNSCKNSQVSPFLHKPLNQCLHTRLLKFELLFTAVCLSGQAEPSGQWP